jgi:hypothetical protein
MTKTCSACQIDKNINEFYSRGNQCKQCRIAQAAKWAAANRDKTRAALTRFKKKHLVRYRAQQREYFERNRELINEKSKTWRRNNRDKWNDYRNDYRKTHINYRLAENLRNRTREVLHGRVKSARTLELLGCSLIDLRQHLESKFLPQMTWENYGQWHIDHIIPCASFDLSQAEQQARCFHYTNLQPLWAVDNVRKAASILQILSLCENFPSFGAQF